LNISHATEVVPGSRGTRYPRGAIRRASRSPVAGRRRASQSGAPQSRAGAWRASRGTPQRSAPAAAHDVPRGAAAGARGGRRARRGRGRLRGARAWRARPCLVARGHAGPCGPPRGGWPTVPSPCRARPRGGRSPAWGPRGRRRGARGAGQRPRAAPWCQDTFPKVASNLSFT